MVRCDEKLTTKQGGNEGHPIPLKENGLNFYQVFYICLYILIIYIHICNILLHIIYSLLGE